MLKAGDPLPDIRCGVRKGGDSSQEQTVCDPEPGIRDTGETEKQEYIEVSLKQDTEKSV